MSVVTKVNNAIDKLFGRLDGPAAPVPVPVAKAPRPAPVPAGASELQKRAAKLAAMSIKCRVAYLRLEGKATVLAATPGMITPFKDQDGRQWFKVLGGSGRSYNVQPKFCDCPAVDSRRIHGFCKHMLAVRMYIRGTQQVAESIIKEKRTPMPDGTNINAAIAKFLKSCCDVHFYASGGLWRGTWLNGYELSQGSGTFEKLGFTQRQLMDYAADHEEIMLALPRKTRGQIRISVHANKQEHRDRRVLREAQVLEEAGQPRRPEIIAEQNAEMETNDALRENFGQQVAAAIREESPPKGNGHREQSEPVDPQDDPGPLAEPTIVGAIVTAHGVFVTLSTDVSEYRPLKEGKKPEQAYAFLRNLGLVRTSKTGMGTVDGVVTLARPA